MNLGKLREFFFQNRPKKKNLLQFLHRCHGLGEMSKNIVVVGELRHL